MTAERRKCPRVVAKYPINVICTGEVIQGSPQDYIFHTYTENISEGGIKITLEREINIGSVIMLELFITDKESLPVKCKGVIRWVKKVNPEGTRPDLFTMGIQLADLTNRVDRKLLGEVISYYLNNRK
jgi:Tfp pilus assembly protein PilZ